MKQLSQQHPKPDAPLYTVFLSENYDVDDVAYYHMVARHPQDPDSVDIIYMFDNQKKLIGLQSERQPYVTEPDIALLVNLSDSPTTYNLSMPRSFTAFPSYEKLTKVLHLNNIEKSSKSED